MTVASERDPSGSGSRWLLIAGIVLVALNLRPAIVSVAPVLEVIRSDLDLNYALVSLLTTIPIFCMGFFALATPFVSRVLGREEGVFWGVTLIGAATAVRFVGHNVLVLFATTVLVGIGIAITQTLLPSLVKIYFPDRVAFATGLYTASLTVGATLASGLTVPLYRLLRSWPAALAFWTLLAVGAVALWSAVLRDVRRSAGRTGEPVWSGRDRFPWRSPLAWAVTLLYTINTSVYYSLLTWLVPRYVAQGWSEAGAGLLLTVFILTGLVGMLSLSAFGDRREDRRLWFIPMIGLTVVGSAGIAFVPMWLPWLWAAATGVGIGGWFTLMLMLPADFAEGGSAADRLSSMSLGVGYMIGAIAPFVIGGLRDLVGDFRVAFVGIAFLTLLGLATCGLFAPGRGPVEV